MKVLIQLDFVKSWCLRNYFLMWKRWGPKLEKEGGIGNGRMERQQQDVRRGELQELSTAVPHSLGADISKFGK